MSAAAAMARRAGVDSRVDALRLSVGIENVDDLYNDLVEAFKAVR